LHTSKQKVKQSIQKVLCSNILVCPTEKNPHLLATSRKIFLLVVENITSKKLRIAVKTSSRAEAKAFRIELRFFKKKDVTIPARELLIMIAITKICSKFCGENG